MVGVIYKIDNKRTNKSYIGKTIQDPLAYWNIHKRNARNGHSKYLYSSMRKYGEVNFDFNIIRTIREENKEDLNKKLCELEKKYIEELNTKTPNGYNLTDGGEGLAGLKFSKEHIKNMSIAQKGRKVSKETRVRLSKACMGRPSPRKGVKLTKETRQKLSDARMGKFKGEDNHFFGKKHSLETIETIRQKNTVYANDPKNKRYNQLNQPHRMRVGMLDKSTDNMLEIFETIAEAKRWIANNTKYKGDVGTISKAISSGRLSYGFKWVELEKKSVETIETTA